MKKEIRKFAVDYELKWLWGVSISQIRKDLDELEKLGVTEIQIEPYESWGSVFANVDAYIERLETDEEYKERIESEIKRKEEERQREMQQYEALKKKFENL